ncbi:uncharacterized protein [Antedon mediterranea]|uniref:uncharacterized protein n=1 Tax=Antedon mediterranea TaxID=105859 RepID=UPI003AF7A7AB
MAWYYQLVNVSSPGLVSTSPPPMENNNSFPLNLSAKSNPRRRIGFTQRQPNWSEDERKLLMNEYKRYRVILEGGNDRRAKEEKRVAWQAIWQTVSQVSTCERTVKEVRKKWHNICFYEGKKKFLGTVKKKQKMEQVSGDHELQKETAIMPPDYQPKPSSPFPGFTIKANDVTDCDEVQNKYMNLAAAELEDLPSKRKPTIHKDEAHSPSNGQLVIADTGLTGGHAQIPCSSSSSVQMQQDLLDLASQKLELERRKLNIEIDILDIDRKRIIIEKELYNTVN